MTDIERINAESALRIATAWLSEIQHYEAPYFGSGDMEAIKKALEAQLGIERALQRLEEFKNPIYKDENGNCVANIDSVLNIIKEEVG